jgi:hypothetical protein
MSQLSFSSVEFGAKRKQTRRDKFLAEMDKVVPWARLSALIEPVYPKGTGGRPPYALETMLRIHFMQQWFALSVPATQEALYDMQSMRQFADLSLTRSREIGTQDWFVVVRVEVQQCEAIMIDENGNGHGHAMFRCKGMSQQSLKNQRHNRDIDVEAALVRELVCMCLCRYTLMPKLLFTH